VLLEALPKIVIWNSFRKYITPSIFVPHSVWETKFPFTSIISSRKRR
jgi:hypothetical protein